MKTKLATIFYVAAIIIIIVLNECKKEEVPSLTTNDVSSISQTTAVSGGEILSEGSSSISVKGVCWGTSIEPTINDNKTNDGNGIGGFISNITGLNPGTTYLVRAYATNSEGTGYGLVKSFQTNAATVPALITTDVTSITQTTSVSGGTITSDGASSIIARGVCWSTSDNPTITDNNTSDGTGTGNFTSNITGLSGNTTYSVRAYATNSIGTAYGNQVSFTTSPLPPTITTIAPTSITATTCNSGGNISNDGGAPIIARGVCWNTTQNPITSNSKTEDGTGIGTFTSILTGLTKSTTYYLRSYATNLVGTNYGDEATFTTSDGVAQLSTVAVVPTSSSAAISGGVITTDGGFAITSRGVCFSISHNPTTSDSKTTDGSGIGAFVSTITGLQENSIYFIRAYAINASGTFYGNELSYFNFGTLGDIDGNVYKTIGIGTQIWMIENLKTTKYIDGSVIPLISDGTTWSNTITPAYCWYNDDGNTYKDTFGALYNWHTINTGKLCPLGWRIPSDNDWHNLALFLDPNAGTDPTESYIAGGKLKESGLAHWESPNTGATNETGFTALPGGYRYIDGVFDNVGKSGFWWSSTEYSSSLAFFRFIYYNSSTLSWNVPNKRNGFSVRCVKD